MTEFATTKVKLVTVIVPFELGDSVANDLRTLGVSGFTTSSAHGWERHSRQAGLTSGASVRLETLATAEMAHAIFSYVVARSSDEDLVAFAQDVEAVPESHFSEQSPERTTP